MSVAVSDKDKKEFKHAAIASGISLVCGWLAVSGAISIDNDVRQAGIKADSEAPVLFDTLYRPLLTTLDDKKLLELKNMQDHNTKVFVTCVDAQVKNAPSVVVQNGKIQSSAVNRSFDADQISTCMKSEFTKKSKRFIEGERIGPVAILGLASLALGSFASLVAFPPGYRLSRNLASEAMSQIRARLSSSFTPS